MAECPYCQKELNLDTVVRNVKGFLKREIMYSCPHCNKILGFGFFFGGFITGRP